MTYVCALLVHRRLVPLKDLGRVTSYQLRRICLHPRDEQGELALPPGPAPASYRERFVGRMVAAGLSRERAEHHYREHARQRQQQPRGGKGKRGGRKLRGPAGPPAGD